MNQEKTMHPYELLKETNERLYFIFQDYLNGKRELNQWEKRDINRVFGKMPFRYCWKCKNLLNRNAFNTSSMACKKCQREYAKTRNYEKKIKTDPDPITVFKYQKVVDRAAGINSRAQREGLPYNLTKHSVELMLNHFLNDKGVLCCAYCNKELFESEDVEIDHFIPVCLGIKGSTEDNIVPSCKPCNALKRDHTFTEWITMMEAILDAPVNKESFWKLDSYLRRYDKGAFDEINYQESIFI
ncbi:HNH endonuclease signature motif containing protein [Neobacillus drentensis]|uniref:HNH endonuclease signature motif containing protein n=1 Tax=Neobacillus drentensis TaxID=220684 RepID=UPI0030025E9D